ncbi:MAG: hypothetical protein GY913_09615 [Proteobacteria bacterium]|nr:hypothetical protein [Pseudomonadota bacterium]MCP4917169.1 hypothetical protein [Pseudomonadota bacterium]
MILLITLACGPKKTPEVAAAAPTCERPGGMFGPVEHAGPRLHQDATRFSELNTTLAKPVEVCSVNGQLETLLRLTCDDGTNPFPDGQTAHAARNGSLGGGGQCDSIIDLYVVTCPEATYEVHMDMYVCAPGEQF